MIRGLFNRLFPSRALVSELWGQRSYLLGKLSDLVSKMDQNATSRTADQILSCDGARMRERLRALARNNETAVAIMDYTRRRVVGSRGIWPQVKTESENLNDEIEKRFKRASRKIDLKGFRSWKGLQDTWVDEQLIGGEAFSYTAIHNGRFVVEPFEPEQLATWMFRSAASGNLVQDGIEYDSFGVPVAYWVNKITPGMPITEADRIDADRVQHLFRASRPTQFRGEPEFAQTAVSLFDTTDANSAELMALRAAAYFGIHIKPDPVMHGSMAGSFPTSLGAVKDAATNEYKMTMKPGGINTVPAEVNLLDGKRPGNQFVPFVGSLLQRVAARHSAPYWAISGDTSKANYSSSRVAELPARDKHREAQELLIEKGCRQAFRAWLEYEIMVNGLRTRGYDVDEILDLTEWQKPGFEWVDLGAEADAVDFRLRTGLITWSQAVSELGRDPREQMNAILADKKLAAKIGVDIPICGEYEGVSAGTPAAPQSDPQADPNQTPQADPAATDPEQEATA